MSKEIWYLIGFIIGIVGGIIVKTIYDKEVQK